MGLEMSASRLLAPYFGSSMLVWANLIGLILIGLTAGYYLGGHLADRRPHPPLLFGIALAAGLLMAAVPWWARPAFAAMASVDILEAQPRVVVGSFAAAAAAFLPAAVLLGCVSPFALRLYNLHLETTGRAGGELYAISTAGSVFGIFVTTFGLVPAVGTRWSMGAWALALVGIAGAGLVWSGGRASRRRGAVALAILAALAGAAALAALGARGPMRPREGLLEERESLYQFAQVVEDRDGNRYLLANEGGGVQSIYRPGSLTTELYFDLMAIVPLWAPGDPVRVLIVGYAGGTLERQMQGLLGVRGPLQVEGVEIDPAMVELGRRHLRSPATAVAVEDARTFVAGAAARGRSYGAVLIDAYSRELYIPFHLATVEFFRHVDAVLEPGGLVALNVNSTRPDGLLLHSIGRTMGAVWPYVYVVPAGYFNYLLLAGRRAEPWRGVGPGLRAGPGLSELLGEFGRRVRPFRPAAGSRVLTDDHAPVEFLTDWMVVEFGRQPGAGGAGGR